MYRKVKATFFQIYRVFLVIALVFSDFFNSDKTHFEGLVKSAFDETKKLSDFVGMLTRLVFIGVFIRFMQFKAHEAHTYYQSAKYGCALSIAIMFAVYYWGKTTMIIAFYFMRDIADFKSKYMKAIIFVSSMWFYFCIQAGLAEGALALAQVAKLNPL